jgi:two-component system response regulator HydG
MQQKILIIDNHRQSIESLRQALENQEYEATSAYSLSEALHRSGEIAFNILLVSGIIVAKKKQLFLEALDGPFSGLPCIIMNASASLKNNPDLRDRPCLHWLPGETRIAGTVEMTAILLAEAKERTSKSPGQTEDASHSTLLGNSQAMKTLMDDLSAVAGTDATVLLRGETGTGKELAARFLHQNSKRKFTRWVAINCAALTETLLESELFGHEKGAFTGAHQQKAGKFEHAGQGTIFLDEIGELSPQVQAKMLRVLDTGEFERVGGNRTLKIQCRIIAASNLDFEKTLAEGRFREDLFYRLNVVSINLPALRDHKEDLPLLVRHFLKLKAEKYQKAIPKVSSACWDALHQHHWPGNVRELENRIERAIILAKGKTLEPQSVLPELQSDPADTEMRSLRQVTQEALIKCEREYFHQLLTRHRGHVSRSAEAAGIDRKTFYRKIKQVNIHPQDYKIRPA